MTTNPNRLPSDDAPRVPSDLAAVPPRPMSPLETKFRTDFEDVRAVVDASNVATTYEYLCVRRSEKGKVIGRPRRMTLRAFLILAILTCLRDRPPAIVRITETANELPEDLLEELGLMKPGEARPTITESQIGHIFNVLATSLDVSLHRRPGKRLRLTPDGGVIDEFKTTQIDRKCLRPELTEEELTPAGPSRRLADREAQPLDASLLAARVADLHGLIDRLLQTMVRPEFNIRTTAIDWTDREAWARGGRHAKEQRDGVLSADPDATWGRRRPSGNRISGSRKIKQSANGLDEDGFEVDKNESYFGYLIHVAVATPELDGPPVPELVLALRIATANDMAGVGPTLTAMVDSIRQITPIDHAIMDRGYTMRSAKDVHLPLITRGVHMTFDLAKTQILRDGTTKQGALMMGGDFYCPMLPRELEVEPMPGPQAERADWAAFHRRRKAREAWMMRRKGKPVADMATQRLQCPAAADRLRCPLRPNSMALTKPDLPEIFDEQLVDIQDNPPKCCTADSFTVKREDGLGRRQLYPFGSPDWIRSYDRRTASERVISHYKKLVRTGRDDVQMFGLTRQTLAVGFATVALNIRLLRGWDEKQNSTA
jgi:hypothetical protein